MPDTILVIDSIVKRSSGLKPANLLVEHLLSQGYKVTHISNFEDDSKMNDNTNPWQLIIHDTTSNYSRVSVGNVEKKIEAALYRIFTWVCSYCNPAEILFIHTIGDEWEQALGSAIAYELKSSWINTYFNIIIPTHQNCMQIDWSTINWLNGNKIGYELDQQAVEVDTELTVVLPPFKKEMDTEKTYKIPAGKKTVLLPTPYEFARQNSPGCIDYMPANFLEFYILMLQAAHIVIPPGGSWLYPFHNCEMIKNKFIFQDTKKTRDHVSITSLLFEILSKKI